MEIDDIVAILPAKARSNAAGFAPTDLAQLSLAELGVTSMQIVEVAIDLESATGSEFAPDELLDFGRRPLAWISEAVRRGGGGA